MSIRSIFGRLAPSMREVILLSEYLPIFAL